MLIKRELFNDLINHLYKKEISLIVGPRQVGKTTLMQILQDYLKEKQEKTLYLNLDYEADKIFFDSQDILVNKIKLELGDNLGFVFIDEIQRKENAGIFLKGIYDQNLPYKFIISGSGSLELKEKIHESLMGRKRLFELGPVSFFEFVNFKTNYKYQNKLLEFFQIESNKTKNYLEEYLNFGGYPRVILAAKLKEKNIEMEEIFKSYLERDISYLLRVEKTESFTRMLKLLASRVGQLINHSKLAGDLNISLPTVKNYLWYAEKTYILNIISPYFKNIKKEIVKSPMIYFNDLGLRNYSLNLFGSLREPDQLSYLFQNLILKIIKDKIKNSSRCIHFWRTKNRAEVDFVIETGNFILPIEVKYSNFTKTNVGKSMKSFIEKYQPEEAWIINLSFSKTIKIEHTVVNFIPFYELIKKEF